MQHNNLSSNHFVPGKYIFKIEISSLSKITNSSLQNYKKNKQINQRDNLKLQREKKHNVRCGVINKIV
jgi:hypothetical protein